jgi:hypothetical protein
MLLEKFGLLFYFSFEFQVDTNDEDVVDLQTELAVWNTLSKCTRDSLNLFIAILYSNHYYDAHWYYAHYWVMGIQNII